MADEIFFYVIESTELNICLQFYFERNFYLFCFLIECLSLNSCYVFDVCIAISCFLFSIKTIRLKTYAILLNTMIMSMETKKPISLIK